MTEGPRVPPHSDESERAAVGAMLLDPDSVVPLARVTFRLQPGAFYVPKNAAAVETIYRMMDAGQRVNLLSVQEVARGTSLGSIFETSPLEMSQYLESCVDACATPAHADFFLDMVRQRWIQRGLIERALVLREDAFKAERGEDLLAEAPQRFADIVDAVVHEPDNGALMDVSVRTWEDAKAYREGDESKRPAIGISTPWAALTELTCGLEPGLIVIGGRPSAGKTTLEDMLAVHAAEAGIAVARGTLDTTHRQLLERTLCRQAGVSLPKLKFGFAGKAQLAACRAARDHIARLPLYINESLTCVEEFCSWVRMMKTRRNIGMATFDYVQLLGVRSGSQFANDNENKKLEEISRMLKGLGNQLGIPVVALSQLNRAVEKDNRNPNMSDLRGSGGLEQAADKVIFLYKDKDKFEQMEESSPGATKHKRPVWCDVVKHKNGETGAMPMWLYAPYFRFELAQSNHGVDFTDDALPSDRTDLDREYHGRASAVAPRDEGAGESGVAYEPETSE